MPTEAEIQTFNAPIAANPDEKQSAVLAFNGYLERLEGLMTKLQNAISRGEQQAVYAITAEIAVDIAQLKGAVTSTVDAIFMHAGEESHEEEHDENLEEENHRTSHARIPRKKK